MEPRLAEAASDVAWRLLAYGSYGGKRTAALRALKRRCPNFDQDERGQALVRMISLVEDARAVVRSNASLINYRGETDLAPFRILLSSHVRDLGTSTVDAVLGMVIFYDHLK